MSENGDAPKYIRVEDDGSITLLPDAHISAENIDEVSFSFDEGQDITESVSKKNLNNKNPVTFIKKGRSGYTPVTVTYRDGDSTSSNFLLENVVIYYTPAVESVNGTYGREFVFFGIPDIYIDKIIKDARDNSGINLSVKTNTQLISGCYWLRCNLGKLSVKNTKIMDGDGNYTNMSISSILKEMKKSIVGAVVFSLSGSMNTEKMDQELDLKDGVYTITMKPQEVYVYDVTDIEGPTLADTNARKKEGSAASNEFVARGAIAAMAAKRLKRPTSSK